MMSENYLFFFIQNIKQSLNHRCQFCFTYFTILNGGIYCKFNKNVLQIIDEFVTPQYSLQVQIQMAHLIRSFSSLHTHNWLRIAFYILQWTDSTSLQLRTSDIEFWSWDQDYWGRCFPFIALGIPFNQRKYHSTINLFSVSKMYISFI